MAGDPRLLFQAKSLPIPAIHGKTRSTIGVRSPRSAKARQALGEGSAQRGSRILRPRPDLGRGVDASPSFKPQLPLRTDLPSHPSPQCPASHPATAAEVSAPRPSRPPTKGDSSVVVRITGMALGWMGATKESASVDKNPNSSCSPSTCALFGPRTPRHLVQRPAKASSSRSSLSANHVGVLRGVVGAYSQNVGSTVSGRWIGALAFKSFHASSRKCTNPVPERFLNRRTQAYTVLNRSEVAKL
jgi:hypothetical protein